MVSEKTIIALIVIAILLSADSIVTISTVNTKLIPQIVAPHPDQLEDTQNAQVSLTIYPQSGSPA